MILVVAWATCREAVRSRSFLGLLAIYALAVLASRIVGWISATDGHIVTADLVMGLQSLIGVLVAVATGTALVHSEIQQRTLYTVLSRPIPRATFVVGKFLGLCGALVAGQAAMAALGLVYLWATGAEVTGWLALAAGLTAVEVLVMAAVGLCLTALTSPLLAAVLALAVYALGHAVATLPQLINHLSGWKAVLAASLASLVPNLSWFAYRGRAIHGDALAAPQALLALGYGVLWIALLVAITVGVFRRRQL
jgi:ABC-type transport system involved in multi-copper enzyme maturation permease subunit